MLYIPSATYRLQIFPGFNLKDVKDIIPYLHELGISTLYAAPFFTSKPGSEHGYDVANPHELNPEVGTLQELQEIAQELQVKGMGWLQDIVPNHMTFHTSNKWLMEVLELGPKSEFNTFFDIDFEHPEFTGKVMVPFLGDDLEKVVAEGQLQLALNEEGIQVMYFDTPYPLSLPLYAELLQQVQGDVKQQTQQLQSITQSDKVDAKVWADFKKGLSQDKQLKQALEQVLTGINQDKDKLQQLLQQQHYLLCNWQLSEEKINYRRFFTVNELICLNMQRQDVFDTYHKFIKELTDQKLFQGLRVDHVDGLFDPDGYLDKLREMAGEEVYLVVEKILEGEENLPENWSIQGNSGYDFLAWISNLYTDATGERKLTQLYRRLVPGADIDYEKLVFEKKIYMLEHHMQGELNNLLRLLQERNLLTDEHPEQDWKQALAVLISSFPVYRIYTEGFPLSEAAEDVIERAFEEAHNRAPEAAAQFRYLRTLFGQQEQDDAQRVQDKLYFVMRSQQFTGPLAAKGVEDTTFYNYNRLLSLNEVGNSPAVFHIRRKDFHELMQYRMRTYPHSINATATHDTKRGEGSRMRLEVLSEIPEAWEEHVTQWQEIAQKYVTEDAPTANDQYFIFQTLLGVMPIEGTVDDTLVERVQEYLTKAFREGKVNTNWTDPNEPYEEAVKNLVQKLLQEDKEFMGAFMPLFKRTAHLGWIYSLCQTLLKVTCPGVPDIYQGCELWDFSLVDPDNRRPVDYELRQQYLTDLMQQEQQDEAQLHQAVLQSPEDAKVKLYLLYKVLNLRKQQKALFDHGDYVPLTFTGRYKDNAIGFARRHEGQWCLVVVPRLLANFLEDNELPLGQSFWGNTAVNLPADAPQEWQHLFGSERVNGQSTLPLSSLLSSFPVALLTAG